MMLAAMLRKHFLKLSNKLQCTCVHVDDILYSSNVYFKNFVRNFFLCFLLVGRADFGFSCEN